MRITFVHSELRESPQTHPTDTKLNAVFGVRSVLLTAFVSQSDIAFEFSKSKKALANGGHRVKALGGRADVGQANLAEVFFARLTRKACFLANLRFGTENEPAKNL